MTLPCPEEPEALYYIVREGANARVLNKDNVPVIAERASVQHELKYYQGILRAPLVAMGVREWHYRYWRPVLLAKDEVHRSVFPHPPKLPSEEGSSA